MVVSYTVSRMELSIWRVLVLSTIFTTGWSISFNVQIQCSSDEPSCSQSHSLLSDTLTLSALTSCGECTVQVNTTTDVGIQLHIDGLDWWSAYRYFYIKRTADVGSNSAMAFTGKSQPCDIHFDDSNILLHFYMNADLHIQHSTLNSSTSLCTNTDDTNFCLPRHNCENFHHFDGIHRITYDIGPSYFDLGGYGHPQLYQQYGEFEHKGELPFCPQECQCSLHFQKFTAHCSHNKTTDILLVHAKIQRTHASALNATGRRITYVEPGAFRGVGVDRIILSNNLLTKIESGTFQGVHVGLNTIELENNAIEDLPSDLFHGLTNLLYLQLRGNRISTLHPDLLQHQLFSYMYLDISSNNFTLFTSQTFSRLPKLLGFVSNGNPVTTLESGTFASQLLLIVLFLNDNDISNIDPGAFRGCQLLGRLHLGGNNLTSLQPGVFDDLSKLKELVLNRNFLTTIHFDTLKPLLNLQRLDLSNNQLHQFNAQTFSSLHQLRFIRMSANKLSRLESNGSGLFELQLAEFSDNIIQSIDQKLFQDKPSMRFIHLRGNPLLQVDAKTFAALDNDTTILVDEPATCCFIENPQCRAQNEKAPYLTCQRLLPNISLRVFMWIFGFGALIGNAGVLIWRCVKQGRENIVQVILIENLAASDLLMGIYMIIIASADVVYEQFFPSYADVWRSSHICKLAGTLFVLSSEASVFIITLISIDRYLAIKYPRGTQRLTKNNVIVILCILWVAAMLLSVIPSSLTDVDPDFYDVSEVCIGLPFVRAFEYINETLPNLIGKDFELGDSTLASSTKDLYYDGIYTYPETSSSPGQYFSIALFLGLNFICFLTIAVCYIMIFKIYKQTSKRAGVTHGNNDIVLAIRMGLIILTDAMCWLPIIVIGILVQTNQLTISPVVYVYIVVFVLPINSAVNPFLYTIATIVMDYRRARKRSNPKPQAPVIQHNSNMNLIESST